MHIDLHQHLWPPGFVEALRARRTAPRLDGWTLHLDGEPRHRSDAADQDVALRAARAAAERIDLVGLSLSPALGVESLPGEQAEELLDLWHAGATALAGPFTVWAAAPLAELDPGLLRRDLGRDGVCGLQLPAPALATTADVDRLGPLLAEADSAGKPVLVHPGPVCAAASSGVRPQSDPHWWPAAVDYVAQLQSAWHAWTVAGAVDHPGLRVAFVALAGLAPLHHERLAARGAGPERATDRGTNGRNLFYETSSYGPVAVDQMAAVVGRRALVHGSDRPNAESGFAGRQADVDRDLLCDNPIRFLKGSK